MSSHGYLILPIIILAVLAFVMVIVHVLVIERGRIGKHSIREAINNLPVAVAFFDKNGLVKLTNNVMNEMFREYASKDLENYDQLKKTIATLEYITLDADSNDRVYLLPNGIYFRYIENIINIDERNYIEAIFYDVTELHNQERELELQSEEIMKNRESLKELSDNLLELMKEKEILEAKTNLHNQMGSALISSRQALINTDESSIDESLSLINKVITTLGSGEFKKDFDVEFDDLIHDATSLGIDIDIIGEIPEDHDVKSFIVLALRTSLTNAVQHGNATHMDVTIANEDDHYFVSITNNGTKPVEEVVPHGGLKNLIRQGDRRGYKVKISSSPSFLLELIIKK